MKISKEWYNHEAVFPRHQKKEIWGTNNDKTNVTYETSDARTKKKLLQKNHFGKKTTMGRLGGCLIQFYSRETSPLILMQLQITKICSVCIGILYLNCETSQLNTYNHKLWMKQSKKLNGDLKPEHKETTNRITTGPITDILDRQAPTFWKRLRRDPSSEDRPAVEQLKIKYKTYITRLD